MEVNHELIGARQRDEVKRMTTDASITELPSTFGIQAEHVIDARSFEPFVDKKRKPHPGCGFLSETLVHERTGLCMYRELTTPISCSGYGDSRTASHEQLKEIVNDIAKECKRMHRTYSGIKADTHNQDKGMGGGVEYRPFCVVISNYGWSILARRNEDGVTKYFQ